MRYERPIDWGTKWVLCRIKHQSNINGNCTFSIRPFGTWNLFVIYSQLHFAQQLDVDGFHFASLRSALSAQLICAPYLFLFVCVFFLQTFLCTNVQVSNRFLHGTRVFSVHLVFNWLSISLDHDLNEFLYRNEKMTGVHTVWVCEEERERAILDLHVKNRMKMRVLNQIEPERFDGYRTMYWYIYICEYWTGSHSNVACVLIYVCVLWRCLFSHKCFCFVFLGLCVCLYVYLCVSICVF